MTDFPTMVYRTPGPHAAPKGTYGYMGVADHAEYDAAIADGWFASIAEAMEGKHAEAVIAKVEKAQAAVDTITEETREQLEAKAKALGVSFNWKTSDEVLAARIAEAA
jgi:hypothetical protein